MAIAAIGVGSGLPLDELLTDLRQAESGRLNQIKTRQTQAETRLSAYGTLKNSLESLNSAASALGKAETFGALSTRVNGDAFTASAKMPAVPGSYNIRVEQLATSQTLITQGQADRTQPIGEGGTLTISFADAGRDNQTLDLSRGTSLADIARTINADSASLGVRATLINDGTEDAPHRLLLTSTETGSQAAVSSLSVSGNAELQAVLGFEQGKPDQNVTEDEALNARVFINQLEVSSQSNTLENAIDGVTLRLGKTSAQAETLNIQANDGVTTQAVEKFVSAYNNLQGTIRSLTSFDLDKQEGSVLTGDALARRLQGEVRNALNVLAPEGDLRSLAQLGIETNPSDGTLNFDEAVLAQALKDNPDDVRAMLSGPNGLSARIDQVTSTFNRSSGLFSVATDGITRSLTDLKQQYDITSQRIDTQMENYRRQFSALDSLVAQMNTMSDYLAQQFSMLNDIGKQS